MSEDLRPEEIVAATTGMNVGAKQSVDQSLKFLISNATQLQRYDGIDDLVCEADRELVRGSRDPRWSEDERLVAVSKNTAIVHHLTVVRSALARALWVGEVFIGVSVLDDLLFSAIDGGYSDPLAEVAGWIADQHLTESGLIVFPLHSFGILGAGALHAFTDERVAFLAQEFGLVVLPQSNSIGRTADSLRAASEKLGLRKPPPLDRIEGWHRNPTFKWLTSNPLLAVEMAQVSGNYYENQFLVVDRIKAAVSFILLLSVQQPRSDQNSDWLLSTARSNNFSTLDFRHYMVLSDQPDGADELWGDMVPMNFSRVELAELSELPTEFDPLHWEANLVEARRIHSALRTVYQGRLHSTFGDRRDASRKRVFLKMTRSLQYFHRSFQDTHESWQSVVSLAVAFETLLMDGYERGASGRIQRRLELLAPDHPELEQFKLAVEGLFRARGKLMHSGESTPPSDVLIAQRAFAVALVGVAERLPSRLATASESAPMRDITGDVQPNDDVGRFESAAKSACDASKATLNWLRSAWRH